MPDIRVSEEQYIQQVLDRIKKKTVYEDDCWRYTGKHVGNGYGSITYRNKSVRLNRFIAYIYHGFPNPDVARFLPDNVICHKTECKFNDCWNPDHLYVGTQKQNVQDQIKAGRFHYGTDNLFDNNWRGPRGERFSDRRQR